MTKRMMIVDCVQGTDEWYQVRLGKVTASCFSDVLNKGVGRKTYMLRLAAERLTGLPQATYTNSVMEWGTQTEPEARAYYEQINNIVAPEVGFVQLNDWVGCSPDGLVDRDGLVEIKCPNSTTHLQTIIDDKMQTKYIPQVQGQLWVCKRQWCDYVSFDPRMPDRPFFCKRIERDEKYIAVLEAAVEQFVKELQEMISQITKTPF